MKIKDLLSIADIAEKEVTDQQQLRCTLKKHWSRSSLEYMDLLDMDLIHLLRAYSRSIDETAL